MSSDPTRPLPPPPGQRRPTFTPNAQYQPPRPPGYEPPRQPSQQQPSPQRWYEQDQGHDRQQQDPRQQDPRQQDPWQQRDQQYRQDRGYDQQQRQYRQDQQYVAAPTGRAPRRRRRRWPLVTAIVLIVLLALAAGADRFAASFAENQMADKIEQNGLPVKPDVTIEGFPFLTQLAARDFNEVEISASNVVEGSLTIASINATLHGMHLIDGFSGARIDSLNGSALITFSALAKAGDLPSSMKLSPGANSSQIKASVSVFGLTASATAQVTKISSDQFDVQVLNAGGVPASILGNLANFKVNVPQLPAGMNIAGVSVTAQGVLITITGHDTTLTQSST